MTLEVAAMALVIRETLGLPAAQHYNETTEDKKFRGFFGAPLPVITDLWNRLESRLGDEEYANPKPKHLLWALVFLKIYSTEEVHCRIVGWPDPKTYRKWSWYFVNKINDLYVELIKLENRFSGYDGKTNCLMSIDGTDCPINEPWPFEEKWYSEKFNGPGVTYEVGVCIKTGSIVWVNGPFNSGMSEVTIFREKLRPLLAEDEAVEADSGYRGEDKLKIPATAVKRADKKKKSNVRSRHERVNGRLKIYNVLNIPFRHMKPRQQALEKHGLCFKAIVVITQLKFEHGEAIDDVDYDDVAYF